MLFPGGSDGKESTCNVEDSGSIPGSGRSPVGRNGNPLQYSCLENPMDRVAWQATVYEVARVRHYLVTEPSPPLARKIMFKILQARLQQYVNHELLDVQAGFGKAEEPEIKLPTMLDHRKCKGIPEKHLLLLHCLC